MMAPYRRTVLCRRVKSRDLGLPKLTKPKPLASKEPLLDIIKLFCQVQHAALPKHNEDTSDDETGPPFVRSSYSSQHRIKNTSRVLMKHNTPRKMPNYQRVPKAAQPKPKNNLKMAGGDDLVSRSTYDLSDGVCSVKSGNVSSAGNPSLNLKGTASSTCLASKIKERYEPTFSIGNVRKQNFQRDNRNSRMHSFKVSTSSLGSDSIRSEAKVKQRLKLSRYKFKNASPIQRVRTTVALPLTSRKEHSERIGLKYEQMTRVLDEGRQALMSAVSSDDDEGFATVVSTSVKKALKDTFKRSTFCKFATKLPPKLPNVSAKNSAASNYEVLLHSPSKCPHKHKDCAKDITKKLEYTNCPMDTTKGPACQNSRYAELHHAGSHDILAEKGKFLSRQLNVSVNHSQKLASQSTQTSESNHISSHIPSCSSLKSPYCLGGTTPYENNVLNPELECKRHEEGNSTGFSSLIMKLPKMTRDSISDCPSSETSHTGNTSSHANPTSPVPIPQVKQIINSAPLLAKRLEELDANRVKDEPKAVQLHLNLYSDAMDQAADDQKSIIDQKPVKPRRSVEQWVMGQQMKAVQGKEMPGYLKPTCSTSRRQRLTLYEILERSHLLGTPCRYMNVTTSRPCKPYNKPYYRQLLNRAIKLQSRAAKSQGPKQRRPLSDAQVCRNIAQRILSTSSSSRGNTGGFDCSSLVCDPGSPLSGRRQAVTPCKQNRPIPPLADRRKEVTPCKQRRPVHNIHYGLHSPRRKYLTTNKCSKHQVCSDGVGTIYQSSNVSDKINVGHKLSSSKSVGNTEQLHQSTSQRNMRRLKSGTSRTRILQSIPFPCPETYLDIVSKSQKLFDGDNVCESYENQGILQQPEICFDTQKESGSSLKLRSKTSRGSVSARQRLGIAPRKKQSLGPRRNSAQRSSTRPACKRSLGYSSSSHQEVTSDSRKDSKHCTVSLSDPVQQADALHSYFKDLDARVVSLQQMMSGSEYSNEQPASEASAALWGSRNSDAESDDSSQLAFSLTELAVLNAGDKKMNEPASSSTTLNNWQEAGSRSIVKKMVQAFKTVVPSLLSNNGTAGKVDAASSNTQLL